MCVLYDISSDHGKFRLLRTFQSIYFICLLFQVFTTQNYIYIYLFIECIVFTVSVYFCFLIMSYGQWFSWKNIIENKCSTNINNSTVINSLRYLITESKTILSKIELENRYNFYNYPSIWWKYMNHKTIFLASHNDWHMRAVSFSYTENQATSVYSLADDYSVL